MYSMLSTVLAQNCEYGAHVTNVCKSLISVSYRIEESIDGSRVFVSIGIFSGKSTTPIFISVIPFFALSISLCHPNIDNNWISKHKVSNYICQRFETIDINLEHFLDNTFAFSLLWNFMLHLRCFFPSYSWQTIEIRTGNVYGAYVRPCLCGMQ